MAKTVLGAVLVAFSCVSSVHAASIDVSIALTDGCSIPAEIAGITRREAQQIWSAGGVKLRWVNARDLPYESARDNWLVVRCERADDADVPLTRSGRTIPIAAIRFLGGAPTNTIVVSLANAADLLERDASESRHLNERFRYLRAVRLGRILGRAIAHEIGHFLNRSAAHTRDGLMRASHPLAHLIGPSRHFFRVDRPELRMADAAPPRAPAGEREREPAAGVRERQY